MAGDEGKKQLQKSYFDVLGICCTSEVPLVEKILKNLQGVKDFSVIVPSRTVIVIHDNLLISQLQIVKALNEARLEASVRIEGVKNFEKKWPSPYTIACGVLLLLSFLKYIFHPLQWLAVGAVAIGIIPIVLRAITALKNLSFGDINLLVIITVVGSIVLKDYWEAATIVFLFTIAEWLESRASHKATAAMSSLVNLVPQRAVLAETGEEVSVEDVKVNTLLAVKDGEVVPIDGIVFEGNCEVDEKTLTGESFPVPKQKDSSVWAGTMNVNGYISIRTTALAEDCVVARMTKLVEEAQNKRSRTQRYIEKCAKYYTPAIVIISAGLAIVPALLKVHNQKYWYHLALVVLVSACPCALVLSTPVAMFCALTKAATAGVFFKGAEYLESLAEVRIMAFDKTGTITRAEFEVTEFRPLLDDISQNTLLYWVSSIESKSSHPLAAALVDFAKLHSVEPKPDKVEEFKNFPGEGIYGKIDGKDVHIGNQKISSRSGCASVPSLEGNVVEGKSIGYIFLDSRPAGIFSLSDVCRTGAKEALQELKAMGIKTAMLTGDSFSAAKHAQNQLGGALGEVHAELLPEDKAKMIKEFQKEASTAMIGDGLNDAPALATADIGISMGISGSALATETGNILLMTNDIQKIPKVRRLARRVKRKIIENMFLSIITKAAIVALAIAGHPLVWAAVLADTGTCLLVILNSMLLLREIPRQQGKCCKSSGASHHHKHKGRVNETTHGNESCCGDQQQKPCQVQTCSSKICASRCESSSTGSGAHDHQVHKHQNSNDKHSCCAPLSNELLEKKNCRGAHKHEAPKHQNPSRNRSCCQSKRGTPDIMPDNHQHQQVHNKCSILVDAGAHGTKHCHDDNHKANSCTGSSSCSSASSSTCHKQHQVKSCVNQVCCQPEPAKTVHLECKNHAAECPNLNNRPVGGCCQSFRKECCDKNSHFGTNFGGGLSEIVIE